MRRDQGSIPVLLRDICAALHIGVRRQPIVPKGKAFLAWDRASEPAPTILLPIEPHKTWDRFCAAHELGHYVLITEYEWIPREREDYWKTEDLCDDFARELLMPSQLFKKTLQSKELPSAYLDMCDRVSRTAMVPWKQVAAKVSDTYPVYFIVFDDIATGTLKASASTFPGGKGRVEVAPDSLLSNRILEARTIAQERGTATDIRVTKSTFRGTRLESIIRKANVENFSLRVSARSAQAKIAAMPFN